MNNAIILLSGGLDSVVSLGLVRENYKNILALTFDYGQKSGVQEIESSQRIAIHFGISHKVIELDWLKKITKTALVSEDNVPENVKDFHASMKAVWVPNRNGLFLNVAACFADSENFSDIIIGANIEEAQTFSDNTQIFIDRINAEFEFSTQVKPKVVAPLINYTKNDIVKLALEKDFPLNLIRSCYNNSQKHCGKCESCIRLKNALEYNKDTYYQKILF